MRAIPFADFIQHVPRSSRGDDAPDWEILTKLFTGGSKVFSSLGRQVIDSALHSAFQAPDGETIVKLIPKGISGMGDNRRIGSWYGRHPYVGVLHVTDPG